MFWFPSIAFDDRLRLIVTTSIHHRWVNIIEADSVRLYQFNQSDEVDSCTQTANIDGILPKSSYAFGNSKGDVIRYNNVQGYVKSCTNT